MRYFEDYEVGQSSSTDTHLVTTEEIVDFAARWDPLAIHTDEAAAARSVFGGLIASGAHTFSISVLLRHQFNPMPAIIAGLGYDEVRFPNPVRPGDRLSFESECIEKHESQSKADRGVVVFRARVLNQDGNPVLTMKSSALIARRPAA
jgi:acyl dehydratase